MLPQTACGTAAGTAGRTGPAPAAGPNQDSLAAAQRRAAELARANALAAARAALAAPVYFDFERAELTAQATAALDAKIPVLNANAGVRIRIAGNCDARGSDEYNLALGQRRAAAAKRYLSERRDGCQPDRHY